MYPSHDLARLDHLALLVSITAVDRKAGRPVSEELAGQIQTVLTKFRASHLDKLSLREDLDVTRKGFNEAHNLLQYTARDFWVGLQRNARRQGQIERLNFYRDPGTNPLPASWNCLSGMGFARRLLAGEERAIEAGYKPTQQPDAGELRAALEAVEALETGLRIREIRMDDATDRLRSARDSADRVLRGQVATLRLYYGNTAAFADALRRYGFEVPKRFRKNKGKPASSGAGNEPGSDPGGGEPGSEPGSDPGSDPGGTQPGSDPGGTQPGTEPEPGTTEPGGNTEPDPQQDPPVAAGEPNGNGEDPVLGGSGGNSSEPAGTGNNGRDDEPKGGTSSSGGGSSGGGDPSMGRDDTRNGDTVAPRGG